jgi:hypothetical protein
MSDTKPSLGRLDITVPPEDFEAGKRNTLNIIIKNPFDEPIKILKVFSATSTILRNPERRGERADVTTESASLSENEESHLVQPQSEVIRQIVLRTQGYMFFKPTKITLDTQVDFHLSSKPSDVLSQVITSSHELRPPLRALIWGSAVGAVIGSSLKFLEPNGALGSILATILIAALSSALMTVLIARGTGIKGVVTVEDFYGGLLVGVLVSYAGSDVFGEFVNSIVK